MTIQHQTALEMKKISIDFNGIKALDKVDFTTKTGYIHGLIGANGAGKSTLMKVLAGVYEEYTGEIVIHHQHVEIRTPKDAKRLGIQIVYQEVDTVLVSYLSVAENILLNELVENRLGKTIINWRNIYKKAQEILAKYKIKLNPKQLVSELTLAQKQMVVIARALYAECQFLILDEPTAPLSEIETNELFNFVRELKEKNVGIIFISHRLPELFHICDGITVMRDGKFIIHSEIVDTSIPTIVEAMLGEKIDSQFPIRQLPNGEKVLEVKNLCDEGILKNISFHVHQGEVVGFCGLVGAGKTELSKALFGVLKMTEGEILIHQNKVNNSTPYHAVKNGLTLVPEERRKEGILVHETVGINLIIPALDKVSRPNGFLNSVSEKQITNRLISRLGIKTPSVHTKVGNLSGGNQQKVSIGKWIEKDASVYIFDEPTKGVDVGAKKDIYRIINDLAESGKGIVYLTCEISEIIGLTDRVYVMYDGKIVKELMTKSTTEAELLFYSTGGGRNE